MNAVCSTEDLRHCKILENHSNLSMVEMIAKWPPKTIVNTANQLRLLCLSYDYLSSLLFLYS